jgi:hypothetical protein
LGGSRRAAAGAPVRPSAPIGPHGLFIDDPNLPERRKMRFIDGKA